MFVGWVGLCTKSSNDFVSKNGFGSIRLYFQFYLQETSIEVMHVIGAFMVFGLGVLFMLLDTSISYLMCPMYNGRYICRVRLAVAMVGLVSLFTSILSKSGQRENTETDTMKQFVF